MKIKLLVALLASSLWCGWAQAQIGDITNPLNGRITVVDAGTCSTANSFVMQQLPQNASTTTVNLSGTFTATLTARVSNNGGATWTTAGAVAAGTTSFATNGFTQICVDATAFTSGTVAVTISTGILQVQSVVSGGSSTVSPSSPAPPMGYYLSSACKDLGISNAFCFLTPGNTQRSNLCTYTSGLTAVTCRTQMLQASASVTTNVATYTFPANVVTSWAVGNSVTVTAFTGGDTFFNITCTLSVVVSVPGATSISCPLTHANAASTTFGTVTNTSAGPFTAFDAGTGNPNGAKRIYGYATSIADSGLSANNNSPLTTSPLTISAFVSSLQVTLSGAAINSSGANTGSVTWGNLDDAAAAAMDLAMASATQCPRAHMAAAYYMFTVPHFYNQPTACTLLPGQYTTSTGGNLVYAAGYELDCRGTGTCVWNLTPGFPESGLGCVNGFSKIACFVVPLEAKFSNFMIDGGGNFNAPNIPTGTNLVEVDGPATLEYFTCTNFASTGTGASGGTHALGLYLWAQISFINIAGCSDLGLGTGTSTVSVTAFRVSIENPRTRAYDLGSLTDYASFPINQHSRYHFMCIDCWGLNQGALGSSMALMRIANAQSVKLVNAHISKYIGGLGINTIVGIQMLGASGGLLDIQDSFLDMTSAGTSTSTGDIGINDQAGYTVHLENTIVKGTSGGNGYTGVAASKFNSNGGNKLGALSVNAAGLLSLSPTDDLSGATGVTPTCPTVTGATATCAAVAGSTNEKGTLRMTVSAAGTAAGTVTMNFVGAFSQSNTPSCNFNWANTGTGAWNARASTWLSTRSSTAPVISWDNNAVALGNLTWDIDYSCKVQ